MTEQEGISKMETVDVKKERERFETSPHVGGQDFSKITYDAELYYVDPEMQIAFDSWLAAKKQAMEELEVVAYQARYKDEHEELNSWHEVSESLYFSYKAFRKSEVETRTLYAKKGE